MFAKLQKATISVVMCVSVCLSICERLRLSTWKYSDPTDFNEILYWSIFQKSVKKIQV
jgi:hypothetical protein